MKITFLVAAALSAACLCAAPVAADQGKPAEKPAKEEPKAAGEGGQQNRMKACNAEASKKQLKGDERRAFMSTCLKG